MFNSPFGRLDICLNLAIGAFTASSSLGVRKTFSPRDNERKGAMKGPNPGLDCCRERE